MVSKQLKLSDAAYRRLKANMGENSKKYSGLMHIQRRQKK